MNDEIVQSQIDSFPVYPSTIKSEEREQFSLDWQEIKKIVDSHHFDSGVRVKVTKNGLGFGAPLMDKSSSMGGAGITDRDLQKSIRLFPFLEDVDALKEKSILFIGNGFSSAPKELLEMNDTLDISVSDMFDYSTLAKDLLSLMIKMKKAQVLVPKYLLQVVDRLVSLSEGFVGPHYFENDTELPSYMNPGSHDVVMNIIGPPLSTLDQQSALLAPGGSLYYVSSTPHIEVLQSFLEENPDFSCTFITDSAEGDNEVSISDYDESVHVKAIVIKRADEA